MFSYLGEMMVGFSMTVVLKQMFLMFLIFFLPRTPVKLICSYLERSIAHTLLCFYSIQNFSISIHFISRLYLSCIHSLS